jgi:hypothetical protein
MSEQWTVRDKAGALVGPYSTEDLGEAISQGTVPLQTLVSVNGSAYQPVNQWPQLKGFKPPLKTDKRSVLLPIVVGVTLVLAFAGGYAWLTGNASDSQSPRDEAPPDGLAQLVAKWPGAKTSADPRECEQNAAALLQQEPSNDAALRQLAMCAALQNRFGFQKQRDALLAILEQRPGYDLERGALLSLRDDPRAEALLAGSDTLDSKRLLARLQLARLEKTPGDASKARDAVQRVARDDQALALRFALLTGELRVFTTAFDDSQVDLALKYVRATGSCAFAVQHLSKSTQPEAIVELGLAVAACGGNTDQLPNIARPETAHAAKYALAAVKLGARDFTGARAALEEVPLPAETAPEAAACFFIRAVLALHAKDPIQANAYFAIADRAGIRSAALGAYIVALIEKREKEAPTRVGPAPLFLAALLSDRVADVRLDPLLDAPDQLHALNPAGLPLVEAMVSVVVEQARERTTEADLALVALFDAWTGKTPKQRAGGEGGALVAAVLSFQRAQWGDAIRALDRLDKDALGVAALKARALEKLAPENADEVWAQLAEQNEELEAAGEMAAARAAVANKDLEGAAARYRVLFQSADSPFEATKALAQLEEAAP